jgi:hypothetical protein
MRTTLGCEQHARHDCGCPGYPNLQTALRDCGGLCQIVPHADRCIRCQAARLIDTLQNRNGRYLERIIDLQNEAEHNAPPAGYINIQLPIGLIETIIETDRILFAIEPIRTAIKHAYNGNDTHQL